MSHKSFEFISAITALLLIASVQSLAQEPLPAAEPQWQLDLSAGAVRWGDLQNMEPAQGGEFSALGFMFEGSIHEYVRQWRTAELYAGVDVAAFVTDSNLPGIAEEISQQGVYVTPSIKLRYRTSEKAYVDVLAGAGWYEIKFAEVICAVDCAAFNEVDSASAFGGYLGFGLGMGGSLKAELKAHFVEFGDMTGLGSHVGSLGGPIVMLSVGWRIFE